MMSVGGEKLSNSDDPTGVLRRVLLLPLNGDLHAAAAACFDGSIEFVGIELSLSLLGALLSVAPKKEEEEGGEEKKAF